MFYTQKCHYLSIPELSSNQILLTYFYLSEQFQKIQFELCDPVAEAVATATRLTTTSMTATRMKWIWKVKKIETKKRTRKLYGDEAAQAAGLRSLKIGNNQMLNSILCVIGLV